MKFLYFHIFYINNYLLDKIYVYNILNYVFLLFIVNVML